MVGKSAFLLCLVAATAFAQCTAPSSLVLTTETTVPVKPVVGQAMYWVFDLDNNSGSSVTFATCAFTLYGPTGFTTTAKVACWTDVVKAGASARFQTGAVWLSSKAPTGAYTYSVTGYNLRGQALGCWQGSFLVVNPPSKNVNESCDDTTMDVTSQTWVPAQPATGSSAYVVLEGTNEGTATNNAAICQITLTQGSYTITTDGPAPCWTGYIAAGANFTVQTGAIPIPADAPTGVYDVEIKAWAFENALVGCWSGAVTVVS